MTKFNFSKEWCAYWAQRDTGEPITAGVPDSPRRNHIDRMTAAEMVIREAVQAVEALGCDTRLTEAVVLLDQARNKVADFIDNKPAGDGDSERA